MSPLEIFIESIKRYFYLNRSNFYLFRFEERLIKSLSKELSKEIDKEILKRLASKK